MSTQGYIFRVGEIKGASPPSTRLKTSKNVSLPSMSIGFSYTLEEVKHRLDTVGSLQYLVLGDLAVIGEKIVNYDPKHVMEELNELHDQGIMKTKEYTKSKGIVTDGMTIEGYYQLKTLLVEKDWYKIRLLSYPYENLRMAIVWPKSDNKRPISRAFYKIWESIHDFAEMLPNSQFEVLVNTKKKVVTAHLAEGPGGFIEAIVKLRPKDNDIYAITLGEDEAHRKMMEVIATNLLFEEFKKKLLDSGAKIDNIRLEYGDLTNPDVIVKFAKLVKTSNKGGVDLVTADGGFSELAMGKSLRGKGYSSFTPSRSYDFKEQFHYQLIFGEIVAAMSLLRKGGDFYLKIFDINTILTAKLIYLLRVFFTDVYITKPITSRPTNSERYVYCVGYTGYNAKYITELLGILGDIRKDENPFINELFGTQLPSDFIDMIKEHNNELVPFITKSISNALRLDTQMSKAAKIKQDIKSLTDEKPEKSEVLEPEELDEPEEEEIPVGETKVETVSMVSTAIEIKRLNKQLQYAEKNWKSKEDDIRNIQTKYGYAYLKRYGINIKGEKEAPEKAKKVPEKVKEAKEAPEKAPEKVKIKAVKIKKTKTKPKIPKIYKPKK